MLAAWPMYMACPGRRVAPGGGWIFRVGSGAKQEGRQETQALPSLLAKTHGTSLHWPLPLSLFISSLVSLFVIQEALARLCGV